MNSLNTRCRNVPCRVWSACDINLFMYLIHFEYCCLFFHLKWAFLVFNDQVIPLYYCTQNNVFINHCRVAFYTRFTLIHSICIYLFPCSLNTIQMKTCIHVHVLRTKEKNYHVKFLLFYHLFFVVKWMLIYKQVIYLYLYLFTMVLLSPVFCFEMLFVPLNRYMYLIFLPIGIHAKCGILFIDKC